MPKDPLAVLCLALLPARIVLDLLWWWTPLGLSVGALGSAMAAVALLAALLLRWRAEGPAISALWRLWAVSASVLLAIGVVRADSPFDALRYGIQLLFPALWLAALLRCRGIEDWPRVWTAAAAIPAAISLGALALGQPSAHVLHGWPRLLGAYGNLHSHASAMAVFTATLGPLAWMGRRRGMALLAGGAALCLAATWVRGSALWVVLSIGIWLVASGRVRGVALLISSVIAAGLGWRTLRERWSDVVALLALSTPEGGLDALGSWRVRIWRESMSQFLRGPPSEIVFGRGFGGHFGLHRHLEPHSDVLSVLYQLGIAGCLVWLAANAGLLAALIRRRDEPLCALAFGLLLSALLVSFVTNDWLFRPTALWWSYGLCGISLCAQSKSLCCSIDRTSPSH